MAMRIMTRSTEEMRLTIIEFWKYPATTLYSPLAQNCPATGVRLIERPIPKTIIFIIIAPAKETAARGAAPSLPTIILSTI